jgi:hypothetical protein
MQKLAVIIGGAVILVAVAAAGTFASLASGGDNPTISTKPAPRAILRLDDIRREDRRADRRANRREDREAEARGRANETGEDVRGSEAEPNDDQVETAIAPAVDDNPGADDHSGSGSSSSGPASGSDHRGGSDDSGSGHGGGGGDD